MSHKDITQALPPNYDELKKAANRGSNWKQRLHAAEELGQWDHPQTIDILKRLMASDPVYQIQETAYEKLVRLGEDVTMPVRKKGDIIKGAGKVMIRVKKSLPADHTFNDFKDKLYRMRSDIYDAYEGDKGSDFKRWLEETWSKL